MIMDINFENLKTKNMKRLIKKIVYILCFLGMFFTTACSDVFNEVTELTTSRLFRPISFQASMNKTKVTLSWVASSNAISYTLQISTDSLDYSTPVVDTTLTQLSYVQELTGSTQYFARVRANSSETTKDSQFNSSLSFKTPSENLFLGYGIYNNTGKLYSAYMTDVKTLDIKWIPGVNVTHLILTSAAGRDSVPISEAEAALGEKVVSSLDNSTWIIKIYNNKIVRGVTSGLVEGDIVLNNGGDLLSALNTATSGQVIVLAPGATFPIGGSAYAFSKSVKIRSLSASNRSVICMTSGTPTATSNMFAFATSATPVDSLVFENIDFTGYCDNNSSSMKIGYLISNKLQSFVTDLKFVNCNIHNFGNTTLRLSGGSGQTITNVIFKGCNINEIGFSSPYALVNSNSADYFTNITFSYCTVYNIKASLILRTGAYTMNSININNCTFNQTMQDVSLARYLIDANLTTITSGISISNCIFGSSGGTLGANGMRTTGLAAISGSYYTSDYVDDPIPVGLTSTSIKNKMISYSGASTSLWADPVNGVFNLKDATFAGKGLAGDLRWY